MGREGVEILLYCVTIGEGVPGSVFITHVASDSASSFHQFIDMIAPKFRGMSEIPHPHNSCWSPAVFT